MEALVVYSLKVAACLAIFYIFYKLLLSGETFHRLNRLLLLGGVAVSFLLPLCTITIEREMPNMVRTEAAVGQLEQTASAESRMPASRVTVSLPKVFPWAVAVGVLLIVGGAVVLAWMLLSFRNTRQIIRRGQRSYLNDGIFISLHNQPIRPFSWWRWIVLSESDYAEEGENIVAHEQAHICCGHSFDLLVVDLFGCLQWFNPAMWLLRRELCALHEYEADKIVLASGADAKHYQLLLIKKAVGGRWYSVANSLNHSNLKNRITMMLRKKSSGWVAAKALLVLPLVCIGLGAFARTSYVVSDDKITENPQLQQGFSGGMTVKPDGDGALRVALDGKGDAMMGAVGLIAMGLSQIENADLVKIEEFTDMLLPLTADQGAEKLGLPRPYCLVGSQPLTVGESVPDASQIDFFMVYDKRKSVEMYGDQGANGAVVITIKRPDQPSQAFAAEARRNDENRPWFRGQGLYGFPGRGAGYSGSMGGGLVPSEQAHAEAMERMSNAQSAMLTPERTFNGMVASHVKDGIVVFTVHGVGDAMVAASSMCKSEPDLQRMIYRLARLAELFPDLMAESAPMCLVDGLVVTEVPQAEYIDRIEVLNPSQGIQEYGVQGENGVVRIVSKKPATLNLAKVQAVLATEKAAMMSCLNPDGELDSPTKVHGFYWTRPAAR